MHELFQCRVKCPPVRSHTRQKTSAALRHPCVPLLLCVEEIHTRSYVQEPRQHRLNPSSAHLTFGGLPFLPSGVTQLLPFSLQQHHRPRQSPIPHRHLLRQLLPLIYTRLPHFSCSLLHQSFTRRHIVAVSSPSVRKRPHPRQICRRAFKFQSPGTCPVLCKSPAIARRPISTSKSSAGLLHPRRPLQHRPRRDPIQLRHQLLRSLYAITIFDTFFIDSCEGMYIHTSLPPVPVRIPLGIRRPPPHPAAPFNFGTSLRRIRNAPAHPPAMPLSMRPLSYNPLSAVDCTPTATPRKLTVSGTACTLGRYVANCAVTARPPQCIHHRVRRRPVPHALHRRQIHHLLRIINPLGQQLRHISIIHPPIFRKRHLHRIQSHLRLRHTASPPAATPPLSSQTPASLLLLFPAASSSIFLRPRTTTPPQTSAISPNPCLRPRDHPVPAASAPPAPMPFPIAQPLSPAAQNHPPSGPLIAATATAGETPGMLPFSPSWLTLCRRRFTPCPPTHAQGQHPPQYVYDRRICTL